MNDTVNNPFNKLARITLLMAARYRKNLQKLIYIN